MSTHTHTVLDAGGVMCTKCLRNDNLVGPKCSKMPFISSSSCPSRDLQEPQEVASDKLITVSTPGPPLEKDASLSESSEHFSADTLDEDDTPDSSIGNEKPQSDAPRKIHSYRRYTPMTSEEELQQIQKDANSVVVPLFEKTLTVSDADPKNGRVVVPKRCAKDYFPKVSEPQGFPIKIQDTSGNDWDFRFRYWPNNNSTMYVLEGLKEYMISKKCQAGDKVTFYRIDPEGKLVIGLKKTQPNVSSRKKQLRTLEKKAKLTSGRTK
ncbi:B3 domain-containing protein [Melia azedarach]|nr:B3 domain-containing protein [Melia azedarach]